MIIYWFLGEFWCFDFCVKGEVPLRKVSAYGNYPLAEARLHKAGTLSRTQESMSSKQYSVDTSIYGVLVTVSFFPNKYGLFSEFLNCFLFFKCSKSNKIVFSLVTLSRCENMKMTFMSLRKKNISLAILDLSTNGNRFVWGLFYPEKKSSQKEKSKSCYIIAFLFLAPSLILSFYFSFVCFGL